MWASRFEALTGQPKAIFSDYLTGFELHISLFKAKNNKFFVSANIYNSIIYFYN